MASVRVRYIVDDVDSAIDFYCNGLGFEVVMHPAPTFAMLSRGVRQLRERGAHFRNDIVDGVGGRQILVDDPAGNPVELFEPTRPEAKL
jgi:hypothetical protein